MVTRMYRLMEVYMLTPSEPDAYERRFAARLQLTVSNPKIRTIRVRVRVLVLFHEKARGIYKTLSIELPPRSSRVCAGHVRC